MQTRTRHHNVVLMAIVVGVAFAIAIVVLVMAPKPRPTSSTVQSGQNMSLGEGGGLVLPLVPLEGDWFYEKNGLEFKATVVGQDIKIHMTSEGDTTALYWHGSFKTSESLTATLTSQKIEGPDEIVLSQSSTKDFRVTENGTLVFDFSALGFTTKVELKR